MLPLFALIFLSSLQNDTPYSFRRRISICICFVLRTKIVDVNCASYDFDKNGSQMLPYAESFTVNVKETWCAIFTILISMTVTMNRIAQHTFTP